MNYQFARKGSLWGSPVPCRQCSGQKKIKGRECKECKGSGVKSWQWCKVGAVEYWTIPGMLFIEGPGGQYKGWWPAHVLPAGAMVNPLKCCIAQALHDYENPPPGAGVFESDAMPYKRSDLEPPRESKTGRKKAARKKAD